MHRLRGSRPLNEELYAKSLPKSNPTEASGMRDPIIAEVLFYCISQFGRVINVESNMQMFEYTDVQIFAVF
jgi:hypothetical protein